MLRGLWVAMAWLGAACTAPGTPATGVLGSHMDDTGEAVPSSGGGGDGVVCAPELGLFADADCDVLQAGIRSFSPQFPLWSDGTIKSRFVYLPPGETIDVSDPDAWVFPVGTKFWKHFDSNDGVRLETRVLEKTAALTGESGWRFETYAWDASGDGVTMVTEGRSNVLGTDHDIPEVRDCADCHSGGDNLWDDPPRQDELLDLALGFGAIQLNHAGSVSSLESLAADGVLSAPIAVVDAVVPGDATDQAALGYLHGNCGGCHGGAHPAKGLTMFLEVGTASVQDTPAYLGNVNRQTDPGSRATGLEEMPGVRVVPGDPEGSALAWRMRQRGADDAQMPPLGTELVDVEGVALIEEWIEGL